MRLGCVGGDAAFVGSHCLSFSTYCHLPCASGSTATTVDEAEAETVVVWRQQRWLDEQQPHCSQMMDEQRLVEQQVMDGQTVVEHL